MRKLVSLTCLVLLMASCGRTSRHDPDDGAGAGGANGQTGGATASGGRSSEEGTGGGSTGGATALGGEGGLPLCEPWGQLPILTPRLRLNHYNWEGVNDSGEHFYEGLVVTASVDASEVRFEGAHLDAWFLMFAESSSGQASDPPLLSQLFSEGEELQMKFRVVDFTPLFAELRRTDGSLVAFIHDGIFQPILIDPLDLPIPWSLEVLCRRDEPGYDFFDQLKLVSEVGTKVVELASYEEKRIEIEGSSFMLTVHYAANIGQCSGDACGLDGPVPGRNLLAQLIALD